MQFVTFPVNEDGMIKWAINYQWLVIKISMKHKHLRWVSIDFQWDSQKQIKIASEECMTVAVFYNPTSWWTITKPRNYKVSKEYFLFIDSKGNMEAGWFWYHKWVTIFASGESLNFCQTVSRITKISSFMISHTTINIVYVSIWYKHKIRMINFTITSVCCNCLGSLSSPTQMMINKN